jgi:anti-sigma regulatory factor (Ser/Thr protein kinase)
MDRPAGSAARRWRGEGDPPGTSIATDLGVRSVEQLLPNSGNTVVGVTEVDGAKTEPGPGPRLEAPPIGLYAGGQPIKAAGAKAPQLRLHPGTDSFVFHLNDTERVHEMVDLLRDGLELDDDGAYHLGLILRELLLNAIIHGNLGIDRKFETAEKAKGTYEEAVEDRTYSAAKAKKKVRVERQVLPESVRFTIRDQGAGFDLGAVRDCLKEGLLSTNGRGVYLANVMSTGVYYSDKGRQVRFEFKLGKAA